MNWLARLFSTRCSICGTSEHLTRLEIGVLCARCISWARFLRSSTAFEVRGDRDGL